MLVLYGLVLWMNNNKVKRGENLVSYSSLGFS